MPRARTEVIATDSASAGGIADARVISQPDSTASARALSSVTDPAAIANATSRRRIFSEARGCKGDAIAACAHRENSADKDHGIQQEEQGTDARVDLAVAIDGHAARDVGEGDAPQQRWNPRPDGDPDVAAITPDLRVDLAAPLQTHAAQDQRNHDEQQRQVKAGKHRGVPLRKRGEEGVAGGNEPDLIPSHTGPIARIAALRRAAFSSLVTPPRKGRNIPTPKSNPSSMK